MKTKYHSTLSAAEAKGGDQTLNNPIRPRWFALALGGFLFTSIFALSAPPVEAQCQQWDVGHAWRFKQGPTNVDLDLDQNGTVITGKANHKIYVKEFEGLANVRGTVDGTVKGDSFAVHIYWTNNTVGVYNGTIGPSGKIEGTGYEQGSPSIKVNWYSLGVMKCADATPATPKARPTRTPSADPAVAADAWINQELRKRKRAKPAATPVSGSGTAGGFIQMHTPAPTPSAEADESPSSDTDDQHKKNKKKNKRHRHQEDDQDQGND
jgi:hypothetical protein